MQHQTPTVTPNGLIPTNRPARMKVVVPGGSGQVGSVLTRAFRADGHQVVVLSRDSHVATGVVPWDGKTLGGWADEIDGADVVINLAGRNVNCRYHRRNRDRIMNSRVDSTRVVGEAIHRAKRPPRIWLNASTATIYAHRFDAPNDEWTGILGEGEAPIREGEAPIREGEAPIREGEAPAEPRLAGRLALPRHEFAKDDFGAHPDWKYSIDVATAWEAALDAADTPHTRRVKLRSAMTLSADAGGIFDVLLGLVRRGLGGPAGDGRQFISWVHYEDFVRALYWIMDHSDLSGAINVSSPNPVPNAEFMRALREAWGIRIGLPAKRWMLELGAIFLRTETELILKSRRVVPGALLRSGFEFRYPEWPDAARALCEQWRALRRGPRATNL